MFTASHGFPDSWARWAVRRVPAVTCVPNVKMRVASASATFFFVRGGYAELGCSSMT